MTQQNNQQENYQWAEKMIKISGNTSPISVKLDYCLGWLDTELVE